MDAASTSPSPATPLQILLRDRVRYANQLSADLFVSIHLNWFQDGRANRGIETYYLGPSDDPFVTELASAENRESGYAIADGASSWTHLCASASRSRGGSPRRCEAALR
jgi:N-acetylmuramoyl-L-alanine amidase